MPRLVAAWRRYWFVPGNEISAAVLRIAFAVSALMTMQLLHQGRGGHPADYSQAGYHPLGILRLLPVPPGPLQIHVWWVLAVTGGLCMLVGFRTRIAAALTAIPLLAIASYTYSFKEAWSHDYNPPLLALLAFLGARGGDIWSVDAWLRRRRGTPAPAPYAHTASVRLAQLAIAIVMVSAAFSKLLSGHLTLDWALSDNLRHQIMVRFDLSGLPRTALASWIVAEPVRWKTAAVLNLIAQLAPLAACIFVRRPLVRAAAGAIFATEVIGLSTVMGFWNPHWFPLVCVFVDWDWVVARLRRRDLPRPTEPVLPGRGMRWYVAAFVTIDLVIAFWHWPLIDQRIGAYPFSSFPMFSSIRARPPYDVHQLYEILEPHVEVECDPPVHDVFRGWLDHYPAERLTRLTSPAELRAALERFRAEAHAAFPEFTFRVVRAELGGLQAQPYPAPARFDRVDVATVAELHADGTFVTRVGQRDAGLTAYVAGSYTAEPDRTAAVPAGGALVTRVGAQWFLVAE